MIEMVGLVFLKPNDYSGISVNRLHSAENLGNQL